MEKRALSRFHDCTRLRQYLKALVQSGCRRVGGTALARFPGSCLAVDLSVSQGFLAALRPQLLQHFATANGLSLGVVDSRRPVVDAESALASMRSALEIVAELAEDVGDVPDFLLTGGCGTESHDVTYEEAGAAALGFGMRHA